MHDCVLPCRITATLPVMSVTGVMGITACLSMLMLPDGVSPLLVAWRHALRAPQTHRHTLARIRLSAG